MNVTRTSVCVLGKEVPKVRDPEEQGAWGVGQDDSDVEEAPE